MNLGRSFANFCGFISLPPPYQPPAADNFQEDGVINPDDPVPAYEAVEPPHYQRPFKPPQAANYGEEEPPAYQEFEAAP